jgi:Ser/Thr protein kinase RdoA (MazF antagonist)
MARVAYSILDAEALLPDLVAAYPDCGVQSCRFYSYGLNDTYQIVAGATRFYFRIYRHAWRTRAEVDAELAAIERAHAAGASVARPVPRRDGSFVGELAAPEGVRPSVLFHEAPGHALRYDTADGVRNAARYGRAVAQLHNATAEWTPIGGRTPIDMTMALDRPLATVGARLTGADADDLARLGAALRARIAAAGPLTSGFCHGDLNSENVYFDGDRATFFDFDFCAWGWRSFEIATFLRGVTLDQRPGERTDALMRAFLGGYAGERCIAVADRASLPAFLLVQRIWMAAVHLEGERRWGRRWLGSAYSRRLVEWLRQWEMVLDGTPAWLAP